MGCGATKCEAEREWKSVAGGGPEESPALPRRQKERAGSHEVSTGKRRKRSRKRPSKSVPKRRKSKRTSATPVITEQQDTPAPPTLHISPKLSPDAFVQSGVKSDESVSMWSFSANGNGLPFFSGAAAESSFSLLAPDPIDVTTSTGTQSSTGLSGSIVYSGTMERHTLRKSTTVRRASSGSARGSHSKSKISTLGPSREGRGQTENLAAS